MTSGSHHQRHAALIRQAPLVGGVGLVLLGVGAWLVAGALRPQVQVEVAGGDLPVNAGAADPRDLRAHNSPTLARNPADPLNLAVASRIDTPRFSCALHVSSDAGATWQRARIPVPEGARPTCYAPDVAFGPAGRLYFSFVTLEGRGNTPEAVWVATSDDGGEAVSTPVRVGGELAFQVRLAVDPEVEGRVWVSWLQAQEVGLGAFPEPGNPIVAARSTDRGASWDDPVVVSDAARQRVVAPVPVVGRGGAVHVAYLDLGDDRLDYHGAHQGRGGPPYPGPWWLVVARSTGTGWSESVVDTLTPSERFVPFLPPFPSIDAGADGRLAVVFHDRRLGDPDVWLWRSDGDGTQWADPVRVNDTAPSDGTVQRLPVVDLAHGRVDVAYYDGRQDPGGPLTEVAFQSSADGGRSFSPRVAVSAVPFDATIGLGSERGLPDLGSRLGLVSGRAEAMVVWTDTRAGTQASNKQDLVRGVVTVSSSLPVPQLPPTLLRVLAFTGLVAGGALLARTVLGGLRRLDPDAAPEGAGGEPPA